MPFKARYTCDLGVWDFVGASLLFLGLERSLFWRGGGGGSSYFIWEFIIALGKIHWFSSSSLFHPLSQASIVDRKRSFAAGSRRPSQFSISKLILNFICPIFTLLVC